MYTGRPWHHRNHPIPKIYGAEDHHRRAAAYDGNDGERQNLRSSGAGSRFQHGVYWRGKTLHQRTMLGFTEEEINKRLPEILRFADIGDFVNQPVKTYFQRYVCPSGLRCGDQYRPGDPDCRRDLPWRRLFQAKCYHKFGGVQKQARRSSL